MDDPAGNAGVEFWSWFHAHHAEVAALAGGDDPRWDAVLARLQSVDPALRFEFSDPQDGVRDLVLTVEGNASKFALVDAMAAAAPSVPGWRIVALKPPMGFDFVTTYEGDRFDPRSMWFLPMTSASRPTALGLRVGLPGLAATTQRRAENAVWIILDTALGERAAATSFAMVEVVTLPAEPEKQGYIELPELPAYLAWHARKLNTV